MGVFNDFIFGTERGLRALGKRVLAVRNDACLRTWMGLCAGGGGLSFFRFSAVLLACLFAFAFAFALRLHLRLRLRLCLRSRLPLIAHTRCQ